MFNQIAINIKIYSLKGLEKARLIYKSINNFIKKNHVSKFNKLDIINYLYTNCDKNDAVINELLEKLFVYEFYNNVYSNNKYSELIKKIESKKVVKHKYLLNTLTVNSIFDKYINGDNKYKKFILKEIKSVINGDASIYQMLTKMGYIIDNGNLVGLN